MSGALTVPKENKTPCLSCGIEIRPQSVELGDEVQCDECNTVMFVISVEPLVLSYSRNPLEADLA